MFCVGIRVCVCTLQSSFFKGIWVEEGSSVDGIYIFRGEKKKEESSLYTYTFAVYASLRIFRENAEVCVAAMGNCCISFGFWI